MGQRTFVTNRSDSGAAATQVNSVIATTDANLTDDGGSKSTRIVTAATTNATVVKAAPGEVLALQLYNNTAAAVFFKFYDKATAPVVGTDVPIWTIPVGANSHYDPVLPTMPYGKRFSAGISYAITNLVADTDATAVAAGAILGSVDWI